MTRVYGIAPNLLEVVPHGVPSLPLVAPDTIKPSLRLAPGPVALSFGLLGLGKGYEPVIEAMPSVIEANPAARYVVLGATHPELIRHEGGGQARRARAVHRRARRRHAGDPELEVERPHVKTQAILETAQALVAGDKGLLAMDESTPTCNSGLPLWGFPRRRRPGAPIAS